MTYKQELINHKIALLKIDSHLTIIKGMFKTNRSLGGDGAILRDIMKTKETLTIRLLWLNNSLKTIEQ